MEYKRIFSDVKRREVEYPNENFARIIVYAPPNFRLPYLVEFQHGNNNNEDWDTDWSVEDNHGDADAIRLAIRILDDYKFKDNVEEKTK